MRVILPPKDKKTFFHPSNLLENLSIMRSQKELEFGYPLKGRPKYDKSHSETAQSSKKTNLAVWSRVMLILDRVLLFRFILSPDKRPKTNKISFNDISSRTGSFMKLYLLQLVCDRQAKL